ncbi:MAG: hypothetical protein PUA56_01700 [Bacillales bacterium]|nr:hypothetical protein [Bacillales bacterium]
MKKNLYFSLLYISFCFLILLYGSDLSIHLEKIMSIYLYTYIPSLLPFILLTNIFLKNASLSAIKTSLDKLHIGVIFDVFIILLSLLTGIPCISIILNHLIKKGIYSKEKANRIIYSYGTLSLPFVYLLFSSLYIIFIILTIETLYYLLIKEKTNTYIKEESSLNEDPFYSSLISLGYIFISICLFTFPIIILEKLFPLQIAYLIGGIFESSLFSLKLYSLNNILLSLFITSSTSLSLCFQIKKTNTYVNMVYYIFSRYLLSILITSCYLVFF